jgi:hypothetical protein
VINQKTTTIMLTVAAVYLFIFLFFSIWWYLVVRSVVCWPGPPLRCQRPLNGATALKRTWKSQRPG